MPLGPTARRVIGLPDPGDWEARKQRRARKKTGASGAQTPPGMVPPQMSNPWEVAARQLQEQRAEPAAPAHRPEPGPEPVAAGPAAPWAVVDEHSGAAFARRFGRGVLWVLVGALALLGAKSVLIPKKAPAPAQQAAPAQSGPSYPADEARAVAARYARAYLAWDEKTPENRAAMLAAVLPDGADTAAGWDGRGRQEVLAVEPGTVTPAAQRQARVRVDVLVRTPAPAPSKPGAPAAPASPAYWVGLDVPVVQAGGRVVVTGSPGMVGVPATGPAAPELTGPQADGPFSDQTTETVKTFFAAYAAGETETVAAPGAVVPPLPSGIALVAVESWTADQGEGADRTGTARVTWQLGGARLEQSYRVRLTRVVSTSAQRWQVASVLGGSVI